MKETFSPTIKHGLRVVNLIFYLNKVFVTHDWKDVIKRKNEAWKSILRCPWLSTWWRI